MGDLYKIYELLALLGYIILLSMGAIFFICGIYSVIAKRNLQALTPTILSALIIIFELIFNIKLINAIVAFLVCIVLGLIVIGEIQQKGKD